MSDATNYGTSAVKSYRIQWDSIPWQLWVVSAVLTMEGLLGNLPAIPSSPVAAVWLGMKCLFIIGFFKRWRPIYVLYLVIGTLHVLAFGIASPVIALINLVLVVLVASTSRYFFGVRRI